MEEDKEKVCLAVSVHAKAGLDRLARHYKGSFQKTENKAR